MARMRFAEQTFPSQPGPVAIVTVRPPGYSHAHAFDDLAGALRWAAVSNGVDAILSERPVRGLRSVILGWHLLDQVAWHPEPDAVLFNLEQVDRHSPWLGPRSLALLRTHEVWDYSERNADALDHLGLRRPILVPIGWSPTLVSDALACARGPLLLPGNGVDLHEQTIDVLFYGSVNARRRVILDELRARGLRVHVGFNVYGAERDRLIARSRCVVNLHFYDAAIFEAVRVSYLVANDVPVISEFGLDPFVERPYRHLVTWAPYSEIANVVVEQLQK